jgi:hypothetical protein
MADPVEERPVDEAIGTQLQTKCGFSIVQEP